MSLPLQKSALIKTRAGPLNFGFRAPRAYRPLLCSAAPRRVINIFREEIPDMADNRVTVKASKWRIIQFKRERKRCFRRQLDVQLHSATRDVRAFPCADGGLGVYPHAFGLDCLGPQDFDDGGTCLLTRVSSAKRSFAACI